MKTRIYIINVDNLEEDFNIENITDLEFKNIAEKQGNVWSSWKSFMSDFNEGYPISSGIDFIREI